MASSAPDHLRTPGLISNRPFYEGINIAERNFSLGHDEAAASRDSSMMRFRLMFD